MSYPRTATPELLARIERVCRMRIAAAAIPKLQDIADEYGVSRVLVKRWMRSIREAIIAGGAPSMPEGSVPRGATPSRFLDSELPE